MMQIKELKMGVAFRNLLIRVNEDAVKLLIREETVRHFDSVCEQTD